MLEKCSFARTKECISSLCLHDISLAASPGALVGIAGPVGSGKSTLIQAILGELHTVRGTVTVKSEVGEYWAEELCQQQFEEILLVPWLRTHQSFVLAEDFSSIVYSLL
ncbi:hypothetical protein MRX96_006978 [Rhipicephalus microplus]